MLEIFALLFLFIAYICNFIFTTINRTREYIERNRIEKVRNSNSAIDKLIKEHLVGLPLYLKHIRNIQQTKGDSLNDRKQKIFKTIAIISFIIMLICVMILSNTDDLTNATAGSEFLRSLVQTSFGKLLSFFFFSMLVCGLLFIINLGIGFVIAKVLSKMVCHFKYKSEPES
jgi:hypothetical protein